MSGRIALMSSSMLCVVHVALRAGTAPLPALCSCGRSARCRHGLYRSPQVCRGAPLDDRRRSTASLRIAAWRPSVALVASAVEGPPTWWGHLSSLPMLSALVARLLHYGAFPAPQGAGVPALSGRAGSRSSLAPAGTALEPPVRDGASGGPWVGPEPAGDGDPGAADHDPSGHRRRRPLGA